MSDLTVTSSPDSCYTGRRGFVTVECREEALRVPLTAELRHRVRALLRRGVRAIVLDVSRVSRIDAVGVGELVRMYNMTRAVNGRLRIARPTARVRALLDRAGIYDLLCTDPELDQAYQRRLA
jgi:anti-anti-sigma factor